MSSITNKKIIFISGRFRAGTSMLWHLFDQLPDYCAWYEPLHPNLLKHIKHVKPKEDHIGIDDYWHSYSQSKRLKEHYSVDFGQTRLYLEKHERWPELKQYIHYLIENSQGKIPVLQFNRMDLRLGWLKNNFPNSTIIHINRSTYPLWFSSRKHIKSEQDKADESYPDAYDLMQWSIDLSKHFPMLLKVQGRNSYFRHYFIYKLSQKMAEANADILLNLENDFIASNNGITQLAKALAWDTEFLNQAENLIQKPQSMQIKLDKPASFNTIEKDIDAIFAQTGLEKLFPSSQLHSIKLEHPKAWSQYPFIYEKTIEELLNAIRFQKDELTALVN